MHVMLHGFIDPSLPEGVRPLTVGILNAWLTDIQLIAAYQGTATENDVGIGGGDDVGVRPLNLAPGALLVGASDMVRTLQPLEAHYIMIIRGVPRVVPKVIMVLYNLAIRGRL